MNRRCSGVHSTFPLSSMPASLGFNTVPTGTSGDPKQINETRDLIKDLTKT